VAADAGSLTLIAAAADGSMRDALSLLDQAIGHGGGALKESEVRDMLGTIDGKAVAEIFQALAADDAGGLLECIAKMDELNPDYDAVLAELLSDLHDMAVYQMTGGQLEDIKPGMAELAQKFGKEDVQLYYQIALTGRRDLSGAPEPRVGFEMTMIRMLAFRPGTPLRHAETGTISKSARTPVSESQPAPVGGNRDSGSNWQQMIEEMNLTGMVKEFASHCVLQQRSKDRIHLAIHPEQEHLLKSAQKDRLQSAIRERYGAGVKLLITAEQTGVESKPRCNSGSGKVRNAGCQPSNRSSRTLW
jgi:DNA polymerase-3 subunit gamma/tau